MAKVWEDRLERVMYPDFEGLKFDGISYQDLVKWLTTETKETFPKEIRETSAATLAELERRWAERQRRAPQAARKVAAS
ncbi:MAG: hypothetical protein LBK23_04320 [Oscillospiraceae bacterium]|nr:hypothetical protein [Oscillospiraceae bacterium]